MPEWTVWLTDGSARHVSAATADEPDGELAVLRDSEHEIVFMAPLGAVRSVLRDDSSRRRSRRE